MQRLEWKVVTSEILRMAVEETGEGWGLTTPIQIMMNLLAQVAQRAIELDDEELNKLMLRLSLYEVANPKSHKFDADLVEKYLKYGKKALLEGSACDSEKVAKE